MSPTPSVRIPPVAVTEHLSQGPHRDCTCVTYPNACHFLGEVSEAHTA